mgnify:CR=1
VVPLFLNVEKYRQERLQLVAPNSTEHALLGRTLRQMEEELNRIFKLAKCEPMNAHAHSSSQAQAEQKILD